MSELFRLEKIEKRYNGRGVLRIEDLSIDDGKIIGFFGSNGSGKSTLFNILSFVDTPTEGKVFYDGIESKKLSMETKRGIVMLPQNPYLLKRSVFENVAYGLKVRGDIVNLEERVYEALNLVGLFKNFAPRPWSRLSGGESQRVALAARLILKPKVLILDEPTSGVDVGSAQLIKEATFLAKEKWNTTLMISSHDHNWLNLACDRKITLFKGEIVDSGVVNLLFGPWRTDSSGNCEKIFADGQRLKIFKCKAKDSNAVGMLSSDKIRVYQKNDRVSIEKSPLSGIVKTLQIDKNGEHIHVEVLIAEVLLRTTIPLRKMHRYRLYPGESVDVCIDTKSIFWY
ncbi:MAG: energy-coupling factor ABC transporter ATP-binding protein [Sulfurovum sp.]|nr:energy-coupling factor ABC transporter ATP-binding protein [Sulfurovum sp.]